MKTMMPSDAKLFEEALRQFDNNDKIILNKNDEKKIRFVIYLQLQADEIFSPDNEYFAYENGQKPIENYLNHAGPKSFSEFWEKGPSKWSLEKIFRECIMPKPNFLARLKAH